ALQKKKGKARPVQALVLACSITCAVFVVLLLQSGTKVNHEEYVYFSWTNFSAIALCWVMMSFFSIRGAE
ncbi:MAG TPA: hypothetical protein VFU15_12870, partial [Bacteroidia bacterium]|nr:hypothetical protein [Bacteroidia bacterium]